MCYVHHHDDYLFVFLCTRLSRTLGAFIYSTKKHWLFIIQHRQGFEIESMIEWKCPISPLFIISLPPYNLNIHIINKRFISSTSRNRKSRSRATSILEKWWGGDLFKKIITIDRLRSCGKKRFILGNGSSVDVLLLPFLSFFLFFGKWKRQEVSESEKWK